MATAQPLLTSPTTFSFGQRASVKNTSLNSESPVIILIGRTSTPGWSIGHEQERDALVLGRVGVGAGQHEDPVGEVAGRRPDLLAVDDPLVAVEHRPGTRGCRGRSRRWARSSPGTRGPRPRGSAGRKCALLLVGAPLQDRVADHLDGEHVVAGRRSARRPCRTPRPGSPARARVSPPPPYSLGHDAAQAGRWSCSVVRHSAANASASSWASAPMPFQSGGQVLGEERLDLLAVRLGLGGIGRLHARRGYCSAAAPGRRRRPAVRRTPMPRAPRPGRPAAAPDERAVGARARRDGSCAPRANSSRARRSSSAWAAAKNGSPKPSATEPATTASRRSSRSATEATARPTSVPVRSTTSGRASAGGRPVMARDGGARRLGLEAAAAAARAQRARRARRSRDRCGRRCRRAPSSSRPSSTMPPPTPVDTTMARKSAHADAAPRPSPRPGPAPWRRCRRSVGQPGELGQPAAQRELAPRRDVQRRDRARRPAVIGPPLPDAARHRSAPSPAPRPRRPGRAARRTARSPSASRPRSARWRRSTTAPSRGRRRPAASLVPPMSTASDLLARRHRPPPVPIAGLASSLSGHLRGRPAHRRRRGAPDVGDAADRADHAADVRRARSARSRATSQRVDPGQGRGDRPRRSSAWWPRATCSSRTCPAWARPAWPRPWPARSTARSAASSSPPTCCRPTSSASPSGTAATSEFEFRPGPDLRQHRARRRDQPGLAQDAVGPARGHGRGPGHRRRRRPTRSARRSW